MKFELITVCINDNIRLGGEGKGKGEKRSR